MAQIIKPTQLDVSKITYSEPKAMGTSGAKTLYINYGGQDKDSLIVIHTPKMKMPYGVSVFTEPGKNPKYTLDLSFGDHENNEKLKQFYEAITNIEEKLIGDAKKNSLAWFKKKTMSEDVIRTIFTSSIKRSKDKDTGEVNNKYPPTLKVKINYWDDEFKCSVWDHTRKKLEGDITQNLTKGQSVTAIVKCSGVWLSGGKFGITWQIQQVKLDKPQSLIGYAFREDEDEDDDDNN